VTKVPSVVVPPSVHDQVTSIGSSGRSPPRRVHTTTDLASGSPDATPKTNGSASSATSSTAAASAMVLVVDVDVDVDVVVDVVEVADGSVGGGLVRAGAVGCADSSVPVQAAMVTVADRARTAPRDLHGVSVSRDQLRRLRDCLSLSISFSGNRVLRSRSLAFPSGMMSP
jgi:hypothetical protein